MKKIILIVIFITFYNQIYSNTFIKIFFNNDIIEQYDLSTISKITFNETQMIIHLNDSTTFLFDLNSINKYIYFNDNTSQTNENLFLSDIKIYPNPNNGNFILKYNAIKPFDNITIKIYTPLGKLIQKKAIEISTNNITTDLYLKNCSNGIYLIKIFKGSNLITNRTLIINK